MVTLVTTVTCGPGSRRCNAAVRPATPEPTTSTSVVSVQPGEGAARRRGSAGRVDIRSVNPAGTTNPRACALGYLYCTGNAAVPLPLSDSVGAAPPSQR